LLGIVEEFEGPIRASRGPLDPARTAGEGDVGGDLHRRRLRPRFGRDREDRSEEHTSELQSLTNIVCRLLLEKKNKPIFTAALPDFPTATGRLHTTWRISKLAERGCQLCRRTSSTLSSVRLMDRSAVESR